MSEPSKNRIGGRWGIIWRKAFTSASTLEGITIQDHLQFIDRWHAAQWLRWVRRNIRLGKLNWKFAGLPMSGAWTKI